MPTINRPSQGPRSAVEAEGNRVGSSTLFAHRLQSISPSAVQFNDGMIKQDIVDKLVNRTGLSQTKAALAVEVVVETMKRSLGRGERIELRGFGVFSIRPRKTGIGRNPKTGEEVAIPPGKAVRFKPGKNLKSI